MRLRTVCALAIALSALLLFSCSSGPTPAAVGTPAFYWAAAQETYAASDYLKTIQHLESVLKTDNEFTSRAYPWHLVLTAGMTKGYAELADNFELGSRANRMNATPFRREMNEYRRYANVTALQFGQAFDKFSANKDAKITLDFSYPLGSAMAPAKLQKIAAGQILAPEIVEDIQRAQIQTSMVQVTTEVVGAPDDTAKTQELFKQSPVQVPRETFMEAMADILQSNAQLYSRTKLDDPKHMEFFAVHAMDTLKTLPETKSTKLLMGKVQKTLKLVNSE